MSLPVDPTAPMLQATFTGKTAQFNDSLRLDDVGLCFNVPFSNPLSIS